MIHIEPLEISRASAVQEVVVHPAAPACPHRLLAIANSNSGKSTVYQNLWVKVYQPFFEKRIFVFCPNADEVQVWLSLGVAREQIFINYELKDIDRLVDLQRKHVLQKSSEKKPCKQCLIILEDLTQSPLTRSRNSRFNTMLSNCRHFGISVWASAQVYHTVERIARINFDNYIFFRIFNKDELNQIAEDNSVDPKEFLRIFRYATEHRPFGFLYIKRSSRKGVQYYAHFNGQEIDKHAVETWHAGSESGTPSTNSESV